MKANETINLSLKTLRKLSQIIRGSKEYGYLRYIDELVDFFNCFGFNDEIPDDDWEKARYSIEKLIRINKTPLMEECILYTFAPVNFIGNIDGLDKIIDEFNNFIMYDGWKVERLSSNIVIVKIKDMIIDHISGEIIDVFFDEDEVGVKESAQEENNHIPFSVNTKSLKLEPEFSALINSRLEEIEICIKYKAPLAAIFLIGSVLESILLLLTINYPKKYGSANCAPKDKTGKVVSFKDWTLNNLIDVSAELGVMNPDTKYFSQGIREYRNFIHPNLQLKQKFSPTMDTARITYHALSISIDQIAVYIKNN